MSTSDQNAPVTGNEPIENNSKQENTGPPVPDSKSMQRLSRKYFEQIGAAYTSITRNLSSLLDRLDFQLRNRKCPYCFHPVSRRTSRKLQPVSSKQEVDVRGISFSLKPANHFECPTCKHGLSSDFFESKSRSIAVIGGPSSGKSTYITVLCELLLNRQTIFDDLGLHATIINEEGQYLFEDYRRLLFEQQRILEVTRLRQQPIVLRVKDSVRGKDSKSLYITLIDTPGEEFNQLDTLVKTHHNLVYADGIILLLNPLDLKGIVHLLRENDKNFNPPQSSPVNNYNIIENLYELFVRRYRIKANKRINIPIAICISRADLLEGEADFNMPVDLDPDETEKEAALEDALWLSEDLLEFLEETDLRLISNSRSRFNDFRVFPLSPLGKAPNIHTKMGGQITGGIEPRGVIHPVLWLLHKMNYI